MSFVDDDKLQRSILEHEKNCHSHAIIEECRRTLEAQTERLKAGAQTFQNHETRIGKVEERVTDLRISVGKIVVYLAGAAAVGGSAGIGITKWLQ